MQTCACSQDSDFDALPRVYMHTHHLADDDLARLYKSVDALVLPTRGEGWGRPQIEVSRGLPMHFCQPRSSALLCVGGCKRRPALQTPAAPLLGFTLPAPPSKMQAHILDRPPKAARPSACARLQAMSMGLPVISTYYSGVTAFLNTDVGYPIRVEGVHDVVDSDFEWFHHQQWAQPSQVRAIVKVAQGQKGEL